jgi:hypothetical protein
MLFACVVAACDPMWGVRVQLRDPANRPIQDATLALACSSSAHGRVTRTDSAGRGFVGEIGDRLPAGCDVYIAKPGFQTQRIRYRELCAQGDVTCERFFAFDMLLQPE